MIQYVKRPESQSNHRERVWHIVRTPGDAMIYTACGNWVLADGIGRADKVPDGEKPCHRCKMWAAKHPRMVDHGP